MKPYWKQAMETNIIQLRKMAYSDNAEQQQLFNKMFDALMREANKRLDRLEKNDYTEYAYEMARDYICSVNSDDTNVKYRKEKTSIENYRTMLSMRTFVSKKSSTLGGQRDIERKRIATFREKFSLDSNWRNKGYISNKRLKGFLSFLSNAPIHNTIFDVGKGQSSELVEQIFGAYNQGNPELEKTLLNLFEYYQLSEKHPEIVAKQDRLYYSDIAQWLAKGTLPESFDLDAMRARYGL